MRHGATGRRSRNRGGGGRRGNNNRMQVFDSNGPDVRIRGTAHQIHEKYVALAKDATGAGDRILAESYSQHAEHYQRVINAWEEENARRKQKTDHSDNAAENRSDRKSAKPNKAQVKEDDLGLPASILGESDKKDAVKNKESQLEEA